MSSAEAAIRQALKARNLDVDFWLPKVVAALPVNPPPDWNDYAAVVDRVVAAERSPAYNLDDPPPPQYVPSSSPTEQRFTGVHRDLEALRRRVDALEKLVLQKSEIRVQ